MGPVNLKSVTDVTVVGTGVELVHKRKSSVVEADGRGDVRGRDEGRGRTRYYSGFRSFR